ncbi:hypothetical protein WS86_22640 [Burkholderia savannae]|nr:hypothetical protein WS86_22640 [Burkholderia savannae]
MSLADKQGLLSREHFSVDGTLIQAWASHADGFGERASALRLLDCVPGRHAKTLGADKAYDMRDCRARKVTPHVARNDAHQGGSAIDGRTSRHVGYGISQVIRKRIEEHFGWGKTVDRIRQTAYRGIKRVDQHFKQTMLASNLTRMARILAAVPKGQCDEPPKRSRCAATRRPARSQAGHPARSIGNSAANRIRNPFKQCPDRQNKALFNSLLEPVMNLDE